MARPRVDAALGELARRRADLSSAHFGLAYRPVAHAPSTEGAACSGAEADARLRRHRGRLAISAPKRQLRRAVDRNALKRVAREAWRLAQWPVEGRGARAEVLAMLKLRKSEPDWKTMGRAALKKLWRAELDLLISRLLRRLSTAGQDAR